LSKGQRFKSAVARNRAKRLGREAFRLMKYRLKTGYDFILLVYSESETASADKPRLQSRPCLQSRQRQLESLFTNAGLLK